MFHSKWRALLAGCIIGAGACGAAAQVATPAESAAAAPPPSVPPSLAVISGPIDFGYHAPKTYPALTFTLMNNGETPVTLLKAKGDCTCTDVTILREDKTLQPGDHTDILVGIEVPRELGIHRREIEITVENHETPFFVEFKIESGYPVRVNGGTESAIVVERKGFFTVDSIENKPFRVLTVNGMTPQFDGFDPATDAPRTEYTLRYDWSAYPGLDLPRWVIVETDHPGAEMIDFQAMVPGYMPLSTTMGWHPIEQRLVLGRRPGDRPLTAQVVLAGADYKAGQRMKVTTSNPDIEVRISGARKPRRGPGIEFDLSIQPRQGLRGFVHSEVYFDTEGLRTGLDLYLRYDEPVAPVLAPGQ